MKIQSLLAVLVAFGAGLSSSNVFAMARGHLPDPTVVSNVDLNLYKGLWYDIAHSPNFFQRKCVSSTAEYEVLSPDSISVFNTCYKANGKKKTIHGVAHIVDPSVPAQLQVQFKIFGRPKGDYWITELDPAYQWAVVSGPGKGFNFILSRVAPISESVKTQILTTLKAKGFDTDEFIFDQY